MSRIWRAFGLQPDRTETFKTLHREGRAATLYLNPPDRALVLCVDENIQFAPVRVAHPHGVDLYGNQPGYRF